MNFEAISVRSKEGDELRVSIFDGETGISVAPGDAVGLGVALGRLVRDSDLRARMGEAGRQRALDRYDEAKVLSRTLDLLGL